MAAKRFLLIVTLVVVLLVSAPYVLGFLSGNSQSQFGGFLINPVDGHSYLAKMQQGFRGEWKFNLPYTAEPGEGGYLFLFYLGLGHLARLIQAPLILVFHGTRILGTVFCMWMIGKLYESLLASERYKKLGMILTVFGSGLGWLAVLGGLFTSDFWVAEAYPFLSMYTNPHFTFGLGLMILALLPKIKENIALNTAIGLMLGIIQPFGVVIIALVKLLADGTGIFINKTGVKEIIRSKGNWATISFCVGGGSILLYQFWRILSDPVLSLWHEQNLTSSPGGLDLVLSFLPCLLLATLGAKTAWEGRLGKQLVIWGATGILLAFVPWSLQRRFLSGIFIPLSALSIYGVKVLVEKTSVKFNVWGALILFLALPTNLIILISGLQAINKIDSKIFLENDLVHGLEWIEENAGAEDLVLVDSETGLYVPSFTGRRVVYGHPFETVFAEEERDFLAGVFEKSQNGTFYAEVLANRGVDLIMVDTRQSPAFSAWLEDNLKPVYRSGEIGVYAEQ